MKAPSPFKAIALAAALSASTAFAEDAVAPAPSASAATTVYRQVMPDGRVIYSDKAIKGGKIDHTITIEPPIKGNLWTTEASPRPIIAPQTERTPINKVDVIPVSGKKKTIDDATSDVIRAEMLLEDAKKGQEKGIESLPGERTGNSSGGARLNEVYERRQTLLARAVADAEAALKKAIAERDALRNVRP